ncbi:MAG: hypothetical protein DMG17_16865, partial [Acidobacteria bacterium]
RSAVEIDVKPRTSYFLLGPGIPEPSFPKVPLLNKRHHIPDDHRVSAIPLLGGLHHEYKLEKIAA